MLRPYVGAILAAIAVPVAAQSEIEIPTTRQPAGKNRELAVRDVSELVIHLNGIGAVPPGVEEEPEPEWGSPGEWLEKAVQVFVSPPLRDSSVSLVSGRYLVSVGTPEQQGWIDGFLRYQSKAPETQILLAAEVYAVDVQSFEKLGLDRNASSYDAEEGSALSRRLDESGSAKKLAPRLITLPWHACNIFLGEQIEYVRDFQVGIDDTGKLFADEVWEFLFDGTRFAIWPMHLEDQEIGLLGEIEITNASRPFPKKEIEASPVGRKLEIETPTFTRTTGALGLAVPVGGYALISCPPIEGRIPVVLIQVRLM